MLLPQKIVELCIYPKMYNILSFYSKGNYSVGISIIEQSFDGKFIRSFKPIVTHRKQNRHTPSRKATVRQNGDKKIYEFMTEQFFVTYNEQSVFLSSMALFKLQLQDNSFSKTKNLNYKDKRIKIYIDLKLYLNKTKTVRVVDQDSSQIPQINKSNNAIDLNKKVSPAQNKNEETKNQMNSLAASLGSPTLYNNSNFEINIKKLQKPQKTKTIKKVIQVDKRRIYLNIDKITEIDTYKRVLFSQCEYFSILDLYIGSVYLGTKFRSQNYNMTEFSQMEEASKINNHLKCLKIRQQISDCKQQSGQLLKKSSGLHMTKIISLNTDALPVLQLQQFRKKYSNLSQGCLSYLKQRIQYLLKIANIEKLSNKIPQYKVLFNCLQNDLHLPINTIKNIKQLKQYFGVDNINQLYYQIYREICELDCYIRGLWQAYCTLVLNLEIVYFAQFIEKNFKRESDMKKKNSIVYEESIKDHIRKSHHGVFLQRRKQMIDDMDIFEEDDIYHPFLMLQSYEPQIIQNLTQKQKDTSQINITSLVVFVHGYQGSDYDLQKAKNYLNLYSPISYGLMIKSIQDEIDEDLEHLGLRVAEEIKNHLRLTVNNYTKINFFGYSLGGVIIRESLRHLQDYKSKMNVFITLASPHLGVVKNDNALVGTGIWYLINITKVKNLKQLNCQQIQVAKKQKNIASTEQNIEASRQLQRQQEVLYQQKTNCFLQRLSNSDCLEWFKKMIVVSSKQDNFVPYYSSRIDSQPGQFTSDQRIAKMSQNILKKAKKIERVEVWFDVEHDINTFDKILGRRAHIQFLENRIFLDLFFRMYSYQL